MGLLSFLFGDVDKRQVDRARTMPINTFAASAFFLRSFCKDVESQQSKKLYNDFRALLCASALWSAEAAIALRYNDRKLHQKISNTMDDTLRRGVELTRKTPSDLWTVELILDTIARRAELATNFPIAYWDDAVEIVSSEQAVEYFGILRSLDGVPRSEQIFCGRLATLSDYTFRETAIPEFPSIGPEIRNRSTQFCLNTGISLVFGPFPPWFKTEMYCGLLGQDGNALLSRP